MYIVKVLKRKDAASVVVAVILALILAEVLPTVTSDLATYLSGIDSDSASEWRFTVIRPIISTILQVIVLEAFLRVAIFLRPFFVTKKTSKK